MMVVPLVIGAVINTSPCRRLRSAVLPPPYLKRRGAADWRFSAVYGSRYQCESRAPGVIAGGDDASLAACRHRHWPGVEHLFRCGGYFAWSGVAIIALHMYRMADFMLRW